MPDLLLHVELRLTNGQRVICAGIALSVARRLIPPIADMASLGAGVESWQQ
jgi:hypothetical protein